MKDAEIKKIKDFSHNISTPLTTIMGYTELLRRELSKHGLDSTRNSKWTETIRKEVLKVSNYAKSINKIASKNLPD